MAARREGEAGPNAGIWNAAIGKPVAPPLVHGEVVYAAAFSRSRTSTA